MSTQFPVLHIRRIHTGIYDWQLTLQGGLLAHDDGLASIEECFSHALNDVPNDAHAVEIWYRSVRLGTYPIQAFEAAPDVLAARIVELFSVAMDSRLGC